MLYLPVLFNKVDTLGFVDARVVICAVVDLLLAVFTGVAGLADTAVRFDQVLAGGVVLAQVPSAVVNVRLTAIALETPLTLAAERGIGADLATEQSIGNYEASRNSAI